VAKVAARQLFRIFLSHSSKDKWIARQCAFHLEKLPGVEVFLDEKDIEFGQSIPDSVRTGIENCDEFLVLLSRYSKDRPWVLIEMGAAWGLRKPIVAMIDKIEPKEMPDIISPHKAVDLNEFEIYLKQVARKAKERR
jgi:hypothetical protein